ncbi:MAG: TrbI/VirB10 family protein [Acidobacteria bacterium]|nr:TrbI/VirB10 family protein [Acidobacteriota bacterium]
MQTFRSTEASQPAPAPAAAGDTPPSGGPAAAPAGEAAGLPAPPDPAAVAERMQGANAALLAGLTAGDTAGSAPPARTVPGVTGPAVGPAADPVVVTAPADPPGWERVYEGSVLSAVLVTQLDGDFTGPILAQVAIPFYSADRQRILVPRGARLLGSAQAVEQQDQGRLAVGFHRLVWPDGRWVDLAFHGLNAVGESALADQVDRHYASMFAAAGAVGVLAGLTLQGADPYAGGGAGFRAAAGQGLGQSATQILSRFLNRLPTVTVRAGHRLRVWVTSDFLVPRPEPHPERMYR